MLLITGATGLVGSHVAQSAAALGWPTYALVRQPPGSPMRALLESWGVHCLHGTLADAGRDSELRRALMAASHIVHCAAKVGDWGRDSDYGRHNVDAARQVLNVAAQGGRLERFVMLSSLGVYEPRDHFGTDESVPRCEVGFDPYTRSKAAGEKIVEEVAKRDGVPVIILRPGFIYGPRDRHVLPPLIKALRRQQFAFIGDASTKLDHTYVKNLVYAILRALDARAIAPGRIYNITDEPLVSRREFVGAVARASGIPEPTRTVPRNVAHILAFTSDRLGRWCGLRQAPLLSMARYKFLGLNLEYSIARAKQELGYCPKYSFAAGMAETMLWFNKHADEGSAA